MLIFSNQENRNQESGISNQENRNQEIRKTVNSPRPKGIPSGKGCLWHNSTFNIQHFLKSN